MKKVFQGKNIHLNKVNSLLCVSLACMILMTVSFFSLYKAFEKITYDTISDLNTTFDKQVDTLSESVNSIIINYGMQLFHLQNIQTLMESSDFTNTERVYMTRDLNHSVSSTDFAKDIYVYNSHTGHVYSTDPSYPDQEFPDIRETSIRNILENTDQSVRHKPIYCLDENNEEYYAFVFYESPFESDEVPSKLIVTINGKWYKNSLLANDTLSNMIIVNPNGSVMMSANNDLKRNYKKYYKQITSDKDNGYFIDNSCNEICMYYISDKTSNIYMRISPLSQVLHRLYSFKRSITYDLIIITAIFLCIVMIFLLFALFPMLKLREALCKIKSLQDGSEILTNRQIPIQEQIDEVIANSTSDNLEKKLYDMCISQIAPDAETLFSDTSNFYGLFSTQADHRKTIYNIAHDTHPELVITKISSSYVCIGVFESPEDYHSLTDMVISSLGVPCFISELFSDFISLPEHYRNINELRNLFYIFPYDKKVILETELHDKTSNVTITSKDFSELSVKLKSGNLESSRAKWNEMQQQLSNYRYDDIMYILHRMDDTLCGILSELADDNTAVAHLLPERTDQLFSMNSVNIVFSQTFLEICDAYALSKTLKYISLADQIKLYIEENYHDENLNSRMIADNIHMSTAYIGRLYKNTFNHSINDYINSCRIEESKLLIKQGSNSVEDIAKIVGFANIKYFYVLFKKWTGYTPATYRSLKE